MPKEKLDIIIAVIAISLFILLLVISVLFLFRIYLKRKNKLLLEKERLNIEFEQTLLKSKLEIQEHTFNEISREIHDNIGQVLSLVRINLNTLNAPGEEEKINMMDEWMGKALTDLRHLSHSLDAGHIRNHGWLPPATRLLNGLQKSGKYQTSIEQDDDLPALGNDRPIILFRMIQEIVNNVIKHAEADRIHLVAKKENDNLVIRIQDNGKGFDISKTSQGVGLQNLRSRARMINADMHIQSAPGSGTEVTITLQND
jgi:Signal transduction histidine kinase